MSDPTVEALIAKRDALRNQINSSQIALRVLIRDLDTMEEAIRVFAPELCKGRLAPRPAAPLQLSGRGEIAHNVLIELERAKGPLSTYDIAYAIMLANDMDPADKRQVFLLSRRVGGALRSLSGRKLVKCVSAKAGEYSVWEHVPQ